MGENGGIPPKYCALTGLEARVSVLLNLNGSVHRCQLIPSSPTFKQEDDPLGADYLDESLGLVSFVEEEPPRPSKEKESQSSDSIPTTNDDPTPQISLQKPKNQSQASSQKYSLKPDVDVQEQIASTLRKMAEDTEIYRLQTIKLAEERNNLMRQQLLLKRRKMELLEEQNKILRKR